ncbi:uncharacterized protein ycf68 [Phtheirospermum japonicum]|uniref:Uncharacterized protein ycf68 n=1 Tax=Phtheirospermum japonicum TaxID=374723 RepID=A0A830CKE2_9LAMI|nr:uncharacterized protein ycf68 [Phtheirospermum japonicum]
MCSSAPDPEMWIIQGTLAWRTPPVRTKMEHVTTHLHRPRTTRSPPSFWGDGGIVPFEPFFFARSLVQVQDDPAAPGKRIQEASDYFMHDLLGSGGYSSVGRALLLQLGHCDYGLDV